jgi:uncharacterized membrane protein
MSDDKTNPGGVRRFFRKWFAALFPTILTILVVVFAFGFLCDYISIPMGKGVLWVGQQVSGQDAVDEFVRVWTGQPDFETMIRAHRAGDSPTGSYTHYEWLSVAIGFPVAFLGVFVCGIFFAGFIGRRLYHVFDSTISRFPVVKIIYPYAKQFSEFFFSEQRKMDFDTVVAIPYPRPGVYSLAFITSTGLKRLEEETGIKHVTCFVPTSPTPVTGFVVFVPQEKVIPLSITVDEAVRFFISAGVLTPEHHKGGANLALDESQIQLFASKDDGDAQNEN